MESEDLRAALRAAEAAVRDTIRWLDPAAKDDQDAIGELEGTIATFRRLRARLELGGWPGRTVSAYPAPRERLIDGV